MKTSIPIFALDRQHKAIRQELDEAIDRVIKRGIFILGPEVEAFEREFAEYLGVDHAIGVASGTDALSLALLAAGVGPGDEVILPANSYPSVFGITAIGAVPRLVDIDPTTFLVDKTDMVKHITSKTKAIIPVHLYGNPVAVQDIIKVVKRYSSKIVVIEDCAQAAGATISYQLPADSSQTIEKKVGTIGDIGCFSFYPTKNIGALGDGGMVVTNDLGLAKKVRLHRMYGEVSRYNSIVLGRNSRLDELQAAILRVKLQHLDRWNQRRREIASQYNQKLPATSYQLPAENTAGKHVYHLYVVRCKERGEFMKFLEQKGVGTAIHYPVPIHLAQSMKYLGYKEGDFPKAEKAAREVVSLPMYPELTDKDVLFVSKNVRDYTGVRHE